MHFYILITWLSNPNNIVSEEIFCVFCWFIWSCSCHSFLLFLRSVWVFSALPHRFFCCRVNSFLVAERILSWWMKWGPSLDVAGKILGSLFLSDALVQAIMAHALHCMGFGLSMRIPVLLFCHNAPILGWGTQASVKALLFSKLYLWTKGTSLSQYLFFSWIQKMSYW